MDNTSINLEELINASVKGGRVDVVELAKKLGLEVYSRPMPDKESGHLTYDEASNDTYIEVNQNQPLTRQRFTIAHEIGHYLKHRPILQQVGQLDRAKEYKNAEEIARETEADKEAADILMPNSIVDTYLSSKKWGKNTIFDTSMISDIAHQFRVSRAMVVTRLRDLGFPVPYISFA